MAFDAGMVAAVVFECNRTILGAKIEKIYQPQHNVVTIALRGAEQNRRLLLSASGSGPRVCLSAISLENPQSAPMFCMLLRKHLGGAVIRRVFQPDFERVIHIEFETRDELGFACTRVLICEIMGKCSNLIFTDGDGKILGAVRTVDFSTSQKRQVLPGMKYEAPPKQDKENPLTEAKEAFEAALLAAGDTPCDRFLMNHYRGISPLVAREIAFRATLSTDKPASASSPRLLWDAFTRAMDVIRNEAFVPTLLLDADNRPMEYCFLPIQQYGLSATVRTPDSFGELIDTFFVSHDRVDRVHQRAHDVFKLLSSAESRLTKKLSIQQKELSDCAKKDIWRRAGDLITANIWQLKRGMSKAMLTDWSDEEQAQVEIALDIRLTPSQNAQKYYKKYNKAKTAERMLAQQIEQAQAELAYLDTVFDALTRAETEADLAEIRDELYHSGYASRMKAPPVQKKKQYHPMEFCTSGGYRVLCGKNNMQNEHITHKLAAKSDYWFHAKNTPGSHVILFCDGAEPSETDFTEAASIAAFYCKNSEAKHQTVDYTQVRNLKKVTGAKPGMVIYHTNYSCYVSPEKEQIDALRIK